MSESEGRNIRHFLGVFIGQKLLDVTQHDNEDFDPSTGKGSFVELLFENGGVIHFPVGDEPFSTDHEEECECALCKELEAE